MMKKHWSRGFLLAAWGLAAPALGHVTVEPTDAAAGSTRKLTFRIPHGCDGSPTTAVRIAIPDGVSAVKPKVHPGWTLALKRSDLAKPTKDGHDIDSQAAIAEVAWTGGPLPDEFLDEFELVVKLPAEPARVVVFPVTQECEKGVNHWTEAPGAAKGKGEGARSLPAPVLRLSKG